jgi:hypothetical protein
MLLVAATHYSWNFGDLQCYESTFYLHKVETIRMVNQWLQDPNAKGVTCCAKQIATLCLVEVGYTKPVIF